MADRFSDGVDGKSFSAGFSAFRIRITGDASAYFTCFSRDQHCPGKKTGDFGVAVEYSAWSLADFFRQVNRSARAFGDHSCDEPSCRQRVLCNGWPVALRRFMEGISVADVGRPAICRPGTAGEYLFKFDRLGSSFGLWTGPRPQRHDSGSTLFLSGD